MFEIIRDCPKPKTLVGLYILRTLANFGTFVVIGYACLSCMAALDVGINKEGVPKEFRDLRIDGEFFLMLAVAYPLYQLSKKVRYPIYNQIIQLEYLSERKSWKRDEAEREKELDDTDTEFV